MLCSWVFGVSVFRDSGLSGHWGCKVCGVEDFV